MSDKVIKSIKEILFIYDEKDEEFLKNRQNICKFAFVWNIFEVNCFEKEGSIGLVSKFISDNSGVFENNELYQETFDFFKKRYSDDVELFENKLFKNEAGLKLKTKNILNKKTIDKIQEQDFMFEKINLFLLDITKAYK